MSSSNEPPKKDDSALTFITVKTTLPVFPFPPNEGREPIVTERLVLRPFRPEDIDGMRALRRQPEVMQWTVQGRIDEDLEETRAKLVPFLGEEAVNSYNFAITLRSTGEFIGSGGSHNFRSSHGWPELGYMIKADWWGEGLATEFLKGFAERWRALPREEVDLEVTERSVLWDEEGKAREVLFAITDDTNGGSKAVLRKNGFERFVEWKSGWKATGDGVGKEVTLVGWRLPVGGGLRVVDGLN